MSELHIFAAVFVGLILCFVLLVLLSERIAVRRSRPPFAKGTRYAWIVRESRRDDFTGEWSPMEYFSEKDDAWTDILCRATLYYKPSQVPDVILKRTAVLGKMGERTTTWAWKNICTGEVVAVLAWETE